MSAFCLVLDQGTC